MSANDHGQVDADIAQLYERPGKWASVYFDVSRVDAEADERRSLRRRHVAEKLRDHGVSDGVVEAVVAAIAGSKPDAGDTFAVLADESGIVLQRYLPEPPVRDVVSVGPLPYAAPLIEWQQSVVPHVVVLCDREGADVVAFEGSAVAESTVVSGDTEHVHRGHPGGWSQRRFQQRAENTWERNAKGVAGEVSRIADRINAAILLLAGDERAVGFLQEHLPERWRDRCRLVGGNIRVGDDALEVIADEIVRQVASVVAERTVGHLEEFATALAHDRAVDGVDGTLAALRESRISALLVHDDPDDEREVFFGTEPSQVRSSRDELASAERDSASSARLVDVALRAALATGAHVYVVPAHGANAPADGLGGFLRF